MLLTASSESTLNPESCTGGVPLAVLSKGRGSSRVFWLFDCSQYSGDVAVSSGGQGTVYIVPTANDCSQKWWVGGPDRQKR